MSFRLEIFAASILLLLRASAGFVVRPAVPSSSFVRPSIMPVFATDADKSGPLVSGEQLELILTELDKPLVIDAYATWCVALFRDTSSQKAKSDLR